MDSEVDWKPTTTSEHFVFPITLWNISGLIYLLKYRFIQSSLFFNDILTRTSHQRMVHRKILICYCLKQQVLVILTFLVNWFCNDRYLV